MCGFGVIGQKRKKPVLRQLKKPLIVPKRVISIETDGRNGH
jgi:hypothetical protein